MDCRKSNSVEMQNLRSSISSLFSFMKSNFPIMISRSASRIDAHLDAIKSDSSVKKCMLLSDIMLQLTTDIFGGKEVLPVFLQACLFDVMRMGSIIIVEKEDVTWVVLDPHWFTNQVLGKVINSSLDPFRLVESAVRSSLSIHDIERMITAAIYFENNFEIVPKILEMLGLCVEISGNRWFPAFVKDLVTPTARALYISKSQADKPYILCRRFALAASAFLTIVPGVCCRIMTSICKKIMQREEKSSSFIGAFSFKDFLCVENKKSSVIMEVQNKGEEIDFIDISVYCLTPEEVLPIMENICLLSIKNALGNRLNKLLREFCVNPMHVLELPTFRHSIDLNSVQSYLLNRENRNDKEMYEIAKRYLKVFELSSSSSKAAVKDFVFSAIDVYVVNMPQRRKLLDELERKEAEPFHKAFASASISDLEELQSQTSLLATEHIVQEKEPSQPEFDGKYPVTSDDYFGVLFSACEREKDDFQRSLEQICQALPVYHICVGLKRSVLT